MASKNVIYSLGDYVAVLRRRWLYLATIIPSVVMLAVFLAFALPPTYRSSATILLEPSSIREDLIPTTITTYADQQIELVQRRVMAKDRLAQLIKTSDPYPEMRGASAEAKAGQMAADIEIERVDPITLEPLSQSNAFSLHYHNRDPQRAKEFATRLAELFLAYNRQARTQRAEETYEFLLASSKKLDQRIRDMEEELAKFKREHADALPDIMERNQDALAMRQRDLYDYSAQVRLAEQKEAILALQLRDVSPTLQGAVSNRATELATLRAELADAQQRYTPEHPDVKRLKRAIAALVAAGETSTPSAVTPDNPEYLRISSELEAARRELAAARASAGQARADIGRYQQRLANTPNVEQAYLQLVRDYEIAQTQYADTKNKLIEAELGSSFESQQGGERFALIRTPNLPSTPFSPNRLGVILLGIALGCGLAVGLVALAETSDATVRSARDLEELTDYPTLGAIPVMNNFADRRRQIRLGAWGIAAFTVALVIVSITVARAADSSDIAAAGPKDPSGYRP
jgi:polysaccharide chain length determinant protein (PEP-CTERM system associated)